jgi:hypothetical protein
VLSVRGERVSYHSTTNHYRHDVLTMATEYITQLEGEVAVKVNEANDLKLQNRALLEENARFRSLTEKLLGHAAFRPFLEELSRDPEMASSFAAVVSNSTSSASATPQPQIKKDVNPYEFANNGQQGFSNSQTQHVGMTLVPETQVDFGQLSWGIGNMGLSNFAQPQVFAVLEVPEEPVDVTALSGKHAAEDDDAEETFESAKLDAPAEIEAPAKDVPADVAEEKQTATIEAPEFDEQDPAFTLYATTSPNPAAGPTLEDAVTLLSQLPTEKSPQYELVSESDSQEMSSVFAKNCARLDAACRRMDAMFASFGL